MTQSAVETVDFGCFAKPEGERLSVYMQVEGMRCASCAWTIEQGLQAHPGVEARINFSTQRLRVSWPIGANDNSSADASRALANGFASEIEALGFHVAPFDPDQRHLEAKAEGRSLLSCMAVAGFATLALMLFVDPLWFLPEAALHGATRDLMHWAMGLIAMPATLYCGRPFFRSALAALRHGRTNMDVPISLAVILANSMSLFETIRHGHYVYFDAAVMLLFFLLIGRYLDFKARGKAREAAEGLLAMLEGTARILDGEATRSVRIRDLRPDQVLCVAAGEKVAADGIILSGASDIDTRLVTGETLPRALSIGDKVFAGMISLTAPLTVRISSTADDSLLSEIVGLMEKAEQSQSPYVRFADRVAGFYAPMVHGLAAATFLGWMAVSVFGGQAVTWEDALLKAMAVLIITCPCALGLAVPVVHVLASSVLFRQGILLKSGKGLEALASIDTVVFDKTGTLTVGAPQWINADILSPEDLGLVVGMARQSQHPLSQAIAGASRDIIPADLSVAEIPGKGLKASYGGEVLWLGNARWLGLPSSSDAGMELWFQRERGGNLAPPIRLTFIDAPRADAKAVIKALSAAGLKVCMLSGDREAVARTLGEGLGISDVHAELSPVDKVRMIEGLLQGGARVMMVGDGLNDAAALTAATVSMSPSSGIDITQNAADFVYRGEVLAPVLTTYRLACRTQALVRQNFALSIIYNLVAVPAAVLGLVTPLVAAIAMSMSSLVVVVNSLRLSAGGKS